MTGICNLSEVAITQYSNHVVVELATGDNRQQRCAPVAVAVAVRARVAHCQKIQFQLVGVLVDFPRAAFRSSSGDKLGLLKQAMERCSSYAGSVSCSTGLRRATAGLRNARGGGFPGHVTGTCSSEGHANVSLQTNTPLYTIANVHPHRLKKRNLSQQHSRG